MPGLDLIAGDGVGRPGLDRAECATLDARNLREPGDRIAGHSRMMFQRRLARVLEDADARVVCSCDQRRGQTDLRLAARLNEPTLSLLQQCETVKTDRCLRIDWFFSSKSFGK